jgi:hypothetical protein
MLATLLLVLAAPAALQNARLETRSLDRPLPAAIQAAAPAAEAAWVGWSAPLHGQQGACCLDWGRGQRLPRACCGLESSRGRNIGDDGRDGLAPQLLIVLARVEKGAVDRVRVYTDDCAIDAENRRVVWLEGVKPADSVKWLRGLADSDQRRFVDEALTALALHETPEAVPALVALAREGPSGETRGQALFWLAQRAGAEARAAITRAIEEDPETEVKRQAVFALSEMPRDEGVPLLIELARRHKNPAVREQAFFWLGESEDPRALQFFEEVLR